MDYFFTDIYKSLSEGKTDVGEAIHEAGEELRRQAEQKNKQDQFFSGFNNEDWKKREIVIRKKYEEQITELKQENDELVERMEEINRKWQTEVGLLKERLKEKDNRIRQLLEQSDNNYQFSSRDRPEEESTELFKKTPPQHRKPNLSTMSETVIEDFMEERPMDQEIRSKINKKKTKAAMRKFLLSTGKATAMTVEQPESASRRQIPSTRTLKLEPLIPSSPTALPPIKDESPQRKRVQSMSAVYAINPRMKAT